MSTAVLLPSTPLEYQPDSPGSNRVLGLAEWIDLSPEQVEHLRLLENYDLWFVRERLVRKKLVAEALVDAAILEFKRYMALIVLGNKGIAMLNRDIDEVWHVLILFTKEYAKFCDVVFGEFVHHTPMTSRSAPLVNPQQRFVDLYTHYYGDLNMMWWADLLANLNGDCSGSTNCQGDGGGGSSGGGDGSGCS